ncbi:MAG: hypothetical protein JNJ54_26905 [Myxococcaceae bacterium]|nr:hypothetical protein [Myxococcaceae bacterium]
MDELNTVLAKVGGWKPVAFVLGLVVVLFVLKRLLSRPAENPHQRQVVCLCGWRGTVSRYKPVCPRCGGKDFHDV